MGMEIDRLEILIESEAKKAVGELDKLSAGLNKVATSLTATNTSGLRNFASGMKQLASSMETMSNVKTTDFNRIAKGIEKLGSINQSALYQSANGIRNFANSMNGVASVSDDAVKLGEIAKNISRLGSVSVQRTIEFLPRLSVALRDFMTTVSSSPNVSENLIRMTNAMSSLASNGAKFSSTVGGLNRAAKTLTRSNEEATNSFKGFGKSTNNASASIYTLTHHLNSLVGAYFSLKFIIGTVSSAIKKSMDFTETINLFQTSYKKIGEESAVKNGMDWGSKSADAYAKAFIDRAQTFNDKLTESLSLDPNLMMNYQAVFAQISDSMGLTANTAENISESFTLLGNDIASLWNLNTKDAMEKLQSGLVGQVKPLRELGIDVTNANLQLTAYRYGITQSIAKMSQAEKMQLRWLTIMNQSEVAYGDMAKTMSSPANQLRILEQQWNNLTRTLGNAFLPVVTTVLPYINAVVIALRNMIGTLATAMGYKLPDYTDSKIYTDVTGGIDGIADANDKQADSADKATKANEKLKKSLMGFDELNILTDNSSASSKSGSGSGSSSAGGGSSILDDAINEKTASYMAKFNEQLQNMNDKAKGLADGIDDFFKGVAQGVQPTTDALSRLWNDGLAKLGGFTATALVDFYNDFLAPVASWTFGSAIPRLSDVMNDLLDSVDWDSLNDALGSFYKAVKNMAIGFGDGCIDFIEKLASSVTPELGTATKNLGDGIKSVSDAIGRVDSSTWNRVGYTFMLIVTSLSTAKALNWVGSLFSGIGKGLMDLSRGLGSLDVGAFSILFADIFLSIEESLPKWYQDLMKKWNKYWSDLWSNLFDISETKKFWNDFLRSFGDLFDSSKDSFWDIGRNVVMGILDGLAIPISFILTPVTNILKGIANAFATVFDMHSPSRKMIPIGENIILGVLGGFSSRFEDIRNSIVTLKNNMFEWFGDVKSKFASKGSDIIIGIMRGWNNGWDDFRTWLSNIPSSIVNAIGSLEQSGKNLIKSFIKGFTSLDLPKIKIDVTYNTEGILGKLGKTLGYKGFPEMNMEFYANGGFPTQGQLFIANEKGPELVGSMGGRSNAVVNNYQIEQGIEQASYRGMMNAIMQTGGMSGSQGSPIVENVWKTSNETLYRSTQRGKLKSDRRYQVVTIPT